jgi:hypothetical protein
MSLTISDKFLQTENITSQEIRNSPIFILKIKIYPGSSCHFCRNEPYSISALIG